MKRFILLVCGLFLGFNAVAQEEEDTVVVVRIVDSLSHNRKVVLEQYTGVNSPFCPAAHKLAATYAASHPDSVFIVNVHTGGYATMYRTSWSNSLASAAGFTYYPAASINRHTFSGFSSSAINDTSLWRRYGDSILAKPSFVNVAATAEINLAMRTMSIHVETFFTGEADVINNYIQIATLQSDIVGPQKGKENNPSQVTADGKYNHKYMLRDIYPETRIFLIDTTEETPTIIYPMDSGTFFQWDTIYSIPDSLGLNGEKVKAEMGDIYFLILVTQDSNRMIQTAIKVEPTYVGFPEQITFGNRGAHLDYVLGCNNLAKPSLTVKNESDSIITSMVVVCAVNDTVRWSGNLGQFEKTTITFNNIEVALGGTSTTTFSIDSVNGQGLEDGAPYFSAYATISKPELVEGKGIPSLLLKRDRWGSETTWKLYDGQGHIIQTGGPYEDLNSPPANPDTIRLSAITKVGCYIFEILDSYGDGINNTSGAGNYKIIDGEKTILVQSDGKFGEGEKKDFNIASTVGLDAVSGSIYQTIIYPNPAKNATTLSIALTQATQAQITVTDMLGREVINIGNKALKAGNNNINLNTSDLSNGLYFVNVVTDEGTATKKLAIKR
ncbi:MAG: T9SS type A sorting domain-containing protein [Bacteroidales bacterium]|jgi:hypothetical protein|nr:T9SS type A sorting domain-containing protein [Bacteroidales bacterium]